MNSRSRNISLAVGLALIISGCTLAKVDVNVVSERTSLENQVLGTYNSLSEDMLLVASVRGVSPTGKIEAPPRHTPEQLDATRALETIAFHADDIEIFKRFGWIGENQEGLLTPFKRETPKVPSEELKSFAANYSEAEFQQVVSEVNQAREVLMMRVVQTNENFTVKDLPAIRKVFTRMNHQNSAPGSKVQEADGRWRTL
ncbi:MAG: YdbL family protein [Geobacteraceae bacterium]|nr:YdbL family protein [Geobacteraceae bacterium]NTW79710.1 YdbL family protein [Geobacteraceae bacterium]